MRHRYRYNLNNDTDNNSKDKATTSGTRSTSMRMEPKFIILCIMFAIATGGLVVLFNSKNQLGLGYFYLRPSSSLKADDSASNEYEYERRKEQQLEEVTGTLDVSTFIVSSIAS